MSNIANRIATNFYATSIFDPTKSKYMAAYIASIIGVSPMMTIFELSYETKRFSLSVRRIEQDGEVPIFLPFNFLLRIPIIFGNILISSISWPVMFPVHFVKSDDFKEERKIKNIPSISYVKARDVNPRDLEKSIKELTTRLQKSEENIKILESKVSNNWHQTNTKLNNLSDQTSINHDTQKQLDELSNQIYYTKRNIQGRIIKIENEMKREFKEHTCCEN